MSGRRLALLVGLLASIAVGIATAWQTRPIGRRSPRAPRIELREADLDATPDGPVDPG